MIARSWDGLTLADQADAYSGGVASAAASLARELETLEGVAVEEPEAGDFPVPPPPTASALLAATQALLHTHQTLTARVAALTDGELAAPVPGRPFDKQYQVRSAIRHTVYHSGQIGLLRRAVAGS